MYILLCEMGMMTASCLTWKEGFCKRLIVLGTSMFWQNFSLPSIVQQVPWLAPLIRYVPFFGLGKDSRAFRSFAIQQSQKRMAKVIITHKDLFFYLVSCVYCTTSLTRQLMNGVAWGNQTWRIGSSTGYHYIKFSSCHRRRLGHHCICTISHRLLSYLQSRVSATSQTWAWWIPGNLRWGTRQVQYSGYIAILECCNVRYNVLS